MLAMGYTGKLATRFKEAYIRRFNEMEAELSRRAAGAGDGGNWRNRRFQVTWDEWLEATFHWKDPDKEHERIRQILQIEREASEGRR